ncbi:zinc-binding dehydrogenase [Nocardia stercoris]|uniref:zinc-binding dehydrogenase n=1 Tax=Nocardia stercoris TaxID=2483361 RepID=UPI0018F29BC2|nr:zinc-binding dehydrogenase [Nocardia stercoris]
MAEANRVHRIGDIPLDQAALIEELCIGYHAVRRSGALAGDIAVVAGGGPVGLLTAAALRGLGVTTILHEPAEMRRRTAIDVGIADRVVDPDTESLTDVVAAVSGGRGADVVFDCAGVPAASGRLLDLLTVGGRLVLVALYTESPVFDVNTLIFKELSIQGSMGYVDAHREVIDLVRAGKIDLAPFITARVRARDLVAGGLKRLLDEHDTQVKMIVRL